MKKKPVIMARFCKLEDADRSLDIEFWQKVGPQGIFEAMSQMTKSVGHFSQKASDT